MQTRQWIRQSEAHGWRLASVSGDVIRLCCARHGCKGALKVSIDNPGPVPAPCALPHVAGYAREVFTEYEGLVGELRRRRLQIGLDQIALNEAMGTADGYLSKLEAFQRIAPFPMLQLWAQTLGLSITTAPAALPNATIAAIDRQRSAPYQPNQARFKHA